jgi:hypothetical protein
MPDEKHYTDSHLIERGSSVDIIERCAAFIRQSGDFEGLLDYAEPEEEGSHGKYQKLLHTLTKEAMRIIAKESK